MVPKSRSRGEIVGEIVAELEPLRSGISRKKAEIVVRTQLSAMQNEMDLFHRQSLKKNRDSAKRIRNTIRRLKHQIAAAPPPHQKPRVHRDIPRRATIADRSGNAGIDGRELAEHVTLSGAADRIKFSCAARGHNIMLKCSKKTPASSSANSPLRVIAGLIYEHCTGKWRDLERACEAALRRGVDSRPGFEWLDLDPHARLLWHNLHEDYLAFVAGEEVLPAWTKGASTSNLARRFGMLGMVEDQVGTGTELTGGGAKPRRSTKYKLAPK